MSDEQNEQPTITPEQGEQGQRSRLSDLLAASQARTNILLAEQDAGERREVERQVALDKKLRELIGDQELLRFMKARGIDAVDLGAKVVRNQFTKWSLNSNGSIDYTIYYGYSGAKNAYTSHYRLIDVEKVKQQPERLFSVTEDQLNRFAPDGKILATTDETISRLLPLLTRYNDPDDFWLNCNKVLVKELLRVVRTVYSIQLLTF